MFIMRFDMRAPANGAPATDLVSIAEELADIVIYAMEFANIAELDVATIVRAKMEANAKKYPVDKARGRADKYTEL